MMTAVATVAEVSKEPQGYKAVLSCQQQSSCSGCASKSNCATGQVTKVIGNREHLWTLLTDQPLQVGEQVEIGFPESEIVKNAAKMYLIPLLAMLLGSVLANLVYHSMGGQGEIAAILGGALGFVGSLLWLKRGFAHSAQSRSQQVTLIRQLGAAIQIHQP